MTSLETWRPAGSIDAVPLDEDNPLPVQSIAASSPILATTLLQAGAAATGNGQILDVRGFGVASFLVSGTFSATLTFEASLDASSWQALYAVATNSTTPATTATAAGLYLAGVSGIAYVRARISAYVSGTVTVVATMEGSASAPGLAALPSALTLTDTPQAVIAGDKISVGGVALTPTYVAIAGATNGDNTLQASVSTKKIRVIALNVVAGAAGNIYFTSGAGGTVIWGGSTNKINLAINNQYSLAPNPYGWFETAVTSALVMNASSTGPWGGGFVYVAV